MSKLIKRQILIKNKLKKYTINHNVESFKKSKNNLKY